MAKTNVKPVETKAVTAGDVVKLKAGVFTTVDPQPETFAGKPIRKTKVDSVRGKTVFLCQKLGGYWSWNKDEVVRLKK